MKIEHTAMYVNDWERAKETIDSLTEQLRKDGYRIISNPRTTGDGYYEGCIIDFEDNQIEITI